MKTNTEKREKGFVMVMVALVLVVLIGFVALGVDSGSLFSARTSAQAVADSAALAGAFTFINNPTASQPSTANNYALQIALNNNVMGKVVKSSDVSITTDLAKRRVTVVVNSTQPTYFARALGTATADISVTATAEASTSSSGGCCTRPWFVSNTVFATDNICTAKCDLNQVLVNPTTLEVTDFAKSKYGQQFTIKPQNSDAALSPGEFYLIDLPDSTGGRDYETNIIYGAAVDVQCLDYYSVLTGNKVGPTAHGVDSLIGDPPRYTWQAINEYKRVSDGAIFDIAENVVTTPIWDVCTNTSFCPSGKLSGTTPSLRMVGWSIFFVEGIQGNGVKARLLNVTGCGPGGATDDGSAALTLPLRLVRP